MLKVLTDFFQLFMISTGRQIENYIVFRQNVKETQRFQDSISRQQVPQKKKEQKTNKKKKQVVPVKYGHKIKITPQVGL